jgi:hypothetical protein
MPIGSAQYRRPGRYSGRVQSMRVQSRSGGASLELRLVDASGSIVVVFAGRRSVPGIKLGTRLTVDAVVGQHGGRFALVNPLYEILPQAEQELPPSGH